MMLWRLGQTRQHATIAMRHLSVSTVRAIEYIAIWSPASLQRERLWGGPEAVVHAAGKREAARATRSGNKTAVDLAVT